MKVYKISIAAARINANLTQKKAAELIGVAPRTLCCWERGQTFPTTKQLEKISEVYRIPKDMLKI